MIVRVHLCRNEFEVQGSGFGERGVGFSAGGLGIGVWGGTKRLFPEPALNDVGDRTFKLRLREEYLHG